ncbi:UNVERIFIED_CONTAM: hypothetical protein RF648_21425 [Kocuria sp. CPCC 205274]
MNPPLYERLRRVFDDANLTDGYDAQMLFFEDPEDENVSVMVFRPNGGAAYPHDLGSDHYVTVDVVGSRFRKRETTNRAQFIIDYFRENPRAFGCLGYIQSMGGLPGPIQTEEGRIVYRLPFVCTFGD